MWYFSWVLGVGLALAAGIINVLWLEAFYAFGPSDETDAVLSFEADAQRNERRR